MFGVDERELRDYEAFINGQARIAPGGNLKTFQAILDNAYGVYCFHNGKRALTRILHEEAQPFGVNPRHVVELWEVCPKFYPTNYNLR